MIEKLKRKGREKPCPNCGQALKYSWLSGLNAPLVFFYSKNSDAILVSHTLHADLEKFGDSNDFRQSLLSYSEVRNIKDFGFNEQNSLKCPYCKFEVCRRSENWENDRPIFFDRMRYLNDEAEFEVRVTN